MRLTAATASGSSGNSRSYPARRRATTKSLISRAARDAELVVEVPGPFRRAHPHHRAGCIRSPLPTGLSHDRAAGSVPGSFGVDQDAIEVEEHGVEMVASFTARS